MAQNRKESQIKDTMRYVIVEHLKYNAWANVQIAKILESLDELLLQKNVASSFKNLSKTMLHIWDAEVIWLKRIQSNPIQTWPSSSFKGNKSDLINGFIKSSEELLNFIKDQEHDFIYQKIKYNNLKGDTFENSVEEILFHVVNHGTYHRGQIITILHTLGVSELPSTDLIRFVRSI